MIFCWTRIVFAAALLSTVLTASANPYSDDFLDDLIAGNTRYPSESQIYLPPADPRLTRSCIYIHQHKTSSGTSYASKFDFVSAGSPPQQPVYTQTLITPTADSTCMEESVDHIPLALSRPSSAINPIRIQPQTSSDEDAWDTSQGNNSPRTVDQSSQSTLDENDRFHYRNNGVGLEYWHILYDNGPLTDGRFYSLYYGNPDQSRMESVGLNFVFGTYTLAETGFVANAVESANSIEIDGFVKHYGDQILFIASPYALFSVGYGYMWFNYRYPITYSDGYTSSGEYSRYIELRAGLGGELGRYGALQISAYAGVDARIYYWDNYSDYSGELFQDTFAFTLGSSIGLSY